MEEYPKIQSIYKRDEDTHKFIEGQWSLPEFEYLANNQWVWTEKVDGTNIRVIWHPCNVDGIISDSSLDSSFHYSSRIEFKGKTDNSDIPKFLLTKLGEMFTVEKMRVLFPDTPVCLYGEGYGARIQKGGGNYIPTGVSFVLIDVKIGEWWLKREDIEKIAQDLDIKVVPIWIETTISEAIEIVKMGFTSTWSVSGRVFNAEGLVGKPKIEMRNRSGNRIITKLKHKDFLKVKFPISHSR
jgi:hypothetical protein